MNDTRLVDIDFATLDEEGSARYCNIRTAVRMAMRGTDTTTGVAEVISALICEDQGSLAVIGAIVDSLRDSSLDERDLAGILHNRPLRVKFNY